MEMDVEQIMQQIVLPIITTIMGYLAGKGIIKTCIHRRNGQPND